MYHGVANRATVVLGVEEYERPLRRLERSKPAQHGGAGS